MSIVSNYPLCFRKSNTNYKIYGWDAKPSNVNCLAIKTGGGIRYFPLATTDNTGLNNKLQVIKNGIKYYVNKGSPVTFTIYVSIYLRYRQPTRDWIGTLRASVTIDKGGIDTECAVKIVSYYPRSYGGYSQGATIDYDKLSFASQTLKTGDISNNSSDNVPNYEYPEKYTITIRIKNKDNTYTYYEIKDIPVSYTIDYNNNKSYSETTTKSINYP